MESKINIQKNISKEESFTIKGIAILLMLIHHFFTFPQWIVAGRYLPNSELALIFSSPTKLCVCIFAFLNGYAFALGNRTYKDTINKIRKIFANYWFIAIPAILFAVFICNYKLTKIEIVKELFGLSSAVMIFAWYVPFYCVSIIIITLMQKYLDKSIGSGLLIGIALPICAFYLLKNLSLPTEIKTLFNNLKHWFPCIAVGYLSYKYNGIEKFGILTKKLNCEFVSIALILVCFMGRYFISGLDFIYCFLLVFSIINLHIGNKKIIGQFLQCCGKNSSNMWFLHCLYFAVATREFIQPLAYWAKYPILIYAIAVIQLIVCSELITGIKKNVNKFKILNILDNKK